MGFVLTLPRTVFDTVKECIDLEVIVAAVY